MGCPPTLPYIYVFGAEVATVPRKEYRRKCGLATTTTPNMLVCRFFGATVVFRAVAASSCAAGSLDEACRKSVNSLDFNATSRNFAVRTTNVARSELLDQL